MSLNVNNLNSKKICRLCLKDNKEFLDCKILEVTELIEYCFSIIVNHNDVLPKNICPDCLDTVYNYYKFKKQCIENEIILKSQFIKTENDNEIICKNVDDATNLNNNCVFIKIENDQNNCNKLINSINDHSDIINDNNTTKQSPIVVNLVEKNKNPKRIKNFQKTCNDCFQIFPSKTEYLHHRQLTKHDKNIQEKQPCQLCGKIITKRCLNEHMRIHTGEKPYKCDICYQSFSRSRFLKSHQTTHTGERPYFCDICGQTFTLSTSLRNHQKIHVVNYKFRPIKCNKCERILKGTDKYEKHLKTHNPDYRKPTDKQKNIGETLPLLQLNKFNNHDEYKFICTVCGMTFKRQQQLNRHNSVHTGEKPYKCDICEKYFARSSYLINHKRYHRGEKPYQCQYCPKHFAEAQQLKYHIRLHTGERPYTCTICNKSFALKGNLNVHMRIHTKETPYNCDICGNGFTTSSSRNRHRKNHNNEN